MISSDSMISSNVTNQNATISSSASNQNTAEPGWRLARSIPSLPEVFASVHVPNTPSFWRKLLAFAGPGLMVSVGYMDPGNWATDLAGGAQFGYLLLSVIMISNVMAVLLQHLSLKLGIATGRDLAQACRDHFSTPVSFVLWVLCEIAIAACDLAEVIGSAIALNLLFGLPLVVGVILTASDVLIVMLLQNRGFRYIEALVGGLIFVIGGCFAYELIAAQPAVSAIFGGLLPTAQIVTNPGALYIAICILYQCRHSDHRGGGVLWHRACRRGRYQRRIYAVDAGVGRDVREHALCRGAAGFRAELDADGHTGRPNRDGGLPQYSAAPMAAAPDHSRDRHHSGGDCRGAVRRAWCRPTAGA